MRGLASVVAVVADLSGAAGVAVPLLCLLPDLDASATAQTTPCHSRPIISLGPLLLAAPEPDMYGVLAHEIAHHARPDTWQRRIQRLHRLAYGLTGLTVVGALLGWPFPPAVTLAAVAGLALLAARWCQRREEYACDAAAVAYLNQLGLPGLDYITGALNAATAAESPWYARLGWLWSTHPPVQRRRRHLKRR